VARSSAAALPLHRPYQQGPLRHDLHNLIGAVALPFLIMWGVTGAAFEFPVVEKAWLAITGGSQPTEQTYGRTPNQAPKDASRITAADATAAALSDVPGRVGSIDFPTKDKPYYEIDVISGYGSFRYGTPGGGDTRVLVDSHDATRLTTLNSARGQRPSNRFYDKYFEPAHFGKQVNGWWRVIWLIMGLAPLALMITGVSTWLCRRGVRKRRKRARRRAGVTA
jgi:uncharacterized iron-regulated membrane protein